MTNTLSGRRGATRCLATLALLTLCVAATLADNKIKVTTQHDKAFKFAGLRTYAWHPNGAGSVKVLQNTDDDPEALRARFEPGIKAAVEEALAKRGFTLATAGAPDLHVNYYLLIGPASASQYMGQFLPGSTAWALPPFAAATQSLEVYEQGSLVLDISSPALRQAVWRGIARTEVDRTLGPAERDGRIRRGVTDMLEKFPPR